MNELDKDKHLKANFVEFLEAFARVAEKLSLPPIEELYGDDNEDDDADIVRMTEEERNSQLLWKKIYNLIQVVYISLMTNVFKEKWKWPKVDPKTDLFKDKYCKNPLPSINRLSCT